MECPDAWEWVTHAGGSAEPAPERQRRTVLLEPGKTEVDLSWRKHTPEWIVKSTADVEIFHGPWAVTQRLTISAGGFKGNLVRTGSFTLRVPPGVENLRIREGGRIPVKREAHGEVQGIWDRERPRETRELVLEYDWVTPETGFEEFADENEEATKPKTVHRKNLALIWPTAAHDRQAKVRFWTKPRHSSGPTEFRRSLAYPPLGGSAD